MLSQPSRNAPPSRSLHLFALPCLLSPSRSTILSSQTTSQGALILGRQGKARSISCMRWALKHFLHRFILNYKGLPYKTVFLNFVDIKPTLQALDVPPLEGDHYTVPAIIDKDTGRRVSDSYRIAEYLDAQVSLRTTSVLVL